MANPEKVRKVWKTESSNRMVGEEYKCRDYFFGPASDRKYSLPKETIQPFSGPVAEEYIVDFDKKTIELKVKD